MGPLGVCILIFRMGIMPTLFLRVIEIIKRRAHVLNVLGKHK